MAHCRIALLLALLLACAGVPLNASACATGNPAAHAMTNHAACCQHDSTHSPDPSHPACQHCDACSGHAALQAVALPLIVTISRLSPSNTLPASAPARPLLDRLDRPPR